VIRSLRKRHLATFSVLLVVLPLLYVLALSVRSEPKIVESLPVFGDDAAVFSIVLAEYVHDAPAFEATTRLVADESRAGRMHLDIVLHERIEAPDVLLYWSASDAAAGGQLPADAYLLGSLQRASRQQVPLPRAARERDGHLILYSLGHQEVVASAPLVTRSAEPGSGS